MCILGPFAGSDRKRRHRRAPGLARLVRSGRGRAASPPRLYRIDQECLERKHRCGTRASDRSSSTDSKTGTASWTRLTPFSLVTAPRDQRPEYSSTLARSSVRRSPAARAFAAAASSAVSARPKSPENLIAVPRSSSSRGFRASSGSSRDGPRQRPDRRRSDRPERATACGTEGLPSCYSREAGSALAELCAVEAPPARDGARRSRRARAALVEPAGSRSCSRARSPFVIAA